MATNKDKVKFKSKVTNIFTKEELRELGFKIRNAKFNQLKSYNDNLYINIREDKVIKNTILYCYLL